MKGINFYQKKYEALETFKRRLETTISKAQMLNLQDYGLTDEEISVFDEELEEVEALISML